MNKPQPPINRKSLGYTLKVKKNNFLNKYYYANVDKFNIFLTKMIKTTIIETFKFIKLGVWSLIILMCLLLLNYDFSLINYLSSVAVVLIFQAFQKFINNILKK